SSLHDPSRFDPPASHPHRSRLGVRSGPPDPRHLPLAARYAVGIGRGVSVASGISITKMHPVPGRFRKLMSPPQLLTALRAIDRPRPRPLRSYLRRSVK